MTPAERPRPLAPLPDHRNTGNPAWQRAWAEYAYLTNPLRERGLVCDVAEGHSHKIIYAYPPGHDSVLIIGPEDGGWLVTHQAPAQDWSDFAVVYDSRASSTPPAGPDMRHGRLVEPMLTAIDTHVARLLRTPPTPTITVARPARPPAEAHTRTR